MIDGEVLKRGLAKAVELLRAERENLNAINVYPVADGDTGTNMLLTIEKAMSNVNGSSNAYKVAEEIAEGMLMNAKGNSGTILSQFMWGFMEAIKGRSKLSNRDFAVALSEGANMAYLAVDKPKEGTILSVMRAAAEEALRSHNMPTDAFLIRVYEAAVNELNKTAEAMEKLKGVKVVDSGAYGFVLFLEGIIKAYVASFSGKRIKAERSYKEDKNLGIFCSNFLVEINKNIEEDGIKKVLEAIGDSIVMIRNGRILKVHIHTSKPQEVREFLKGYGNLVREVIEEI